MPERLGDSLKVVGAKQTLKAIQAGQAKLVFLARDADEYVTEPIRQACVTRGIDIVDVNSMAELGRACSIEVGAAVATIVEDMSL